MQIRVYSGSVHYFLDQLRLQISYFLLLVSASVLKNLIVAAVSGFLTNFVSVSSCTFFYLQIPRKQVDIKKN